MMRNIIKPKEKQIKKNNSLEKNIRKPKNEEEEKPLTDGTIIPLGFIRSIF